MYVQFNPQCSYNYAYRNISKQDTYTNSSAPSFCAGEVVDNGIKSSDSVKTTGTTFEEFSQEYTKRRRDELINKINSYEAAGVQAYIASVREDGKIKIKQITDVCGGVFAECCGLDSNEALELVGEIDAPSFVIWRCPNVTSLGSIDKITGNLQMQAGQIRNIDRSIVGGEVRNFPV